MAENPTVAVQQCGQSIWLDYIHRKALSGGELLYFPDAFDEYGRRAITERVAHERLLPVTEPEALKFACNAVSIGKDVVVPAGCPDTVRLLESRGYRSHPVVLDEFMKSGGSAKCLTLALD